MLFVYLAHFTSAYLFRTGTSDLSSRLTTISMIASPTFVAVSGMVVGFLAATNGVGFFDLRIKLLDRGVFLLLVAHLILALTVFESADGFFVAYRTSFVTDAIAVAIIAGPWLVAALNASARVALASITFLLNWLVVVQWHPAGDTLVAVKSYLVGTSAKLDAAPIFAVIPWFAFYLVATVVGERVGKMYVAGVRKEANRLLATIGGVSFLFGGALHGTGMILRHIPSTLGPFQPDQLTFFSIYQKFPPGLVYLAFFGGAGIVLLAAILEIDRRGRIPILLNRLRQTGRASLFMFIAQYALYHTFLERLRLPYTPLWPVIFLLSVIVLGYGAAVWDRHDGNRLLTVGLTSLLRRRPP